LSCHRRRFWPLFLWLLLFLFPSCARPVIKPASDLPDFEIQTTSPKNYFVRLRREQLLTDLVSAIHCGDLGLTCDVRDVGAVSAIEVKGELYVVVERPVRTSFNFMKAAGCGALFICSTDGRITTILRRAAHDDPE
jgi:hypothetical protein